MTYMASNEAWAYPFWDDFDATQLLMLYGILTRSGARVGRQRALGLAMDTAEALEDSLYLDAHEVFFTLMHKASLISDADEFVERASDILGFAPDWPAPKTVQSQ